jgi:multimeric flavodoxin WrbA
MAGHTLEFETGDMMSKHIVILKGSPRERGNSSVLADQVGAGAEAAGAAVEIFYLHGMDIHPCDGCDFCRETGICAVEDDMQMLYPKLLSADAVVLASPIYWFTFSAQLKMCIDRWYALWNSRHDAFKGKPIGIVLTYGDTDLYTSGGINAIHTFETMFRFLQANIMGWVYGSVMDLGDAQKHPELMEQAHQLGKRLAQDREVTG